MFVQRYGRLKSFLLANVSNIFVIGIDERV